MIIQFYFKTCYLRTKITLYLTIPEKDIWVIRISEPLISIEIINLRQRRLFKLLMKWKFNLLLSEIQQFYKPEWIVEKIKSVRLIRLTN